MLAAPLFQPRNPHIRLMVQINHLLDVLMHRLRQAVDLQMQCLALAIDLRLHWPIFPSRRARSCLENKIPSIAASVGISTATSNVSAVGKDAFIRSSSAASRTATLAA
jgi:hypothetical protein